MNTSLEFNIIQRALMLSRVRAFFDARGVLEVDCPALSLSACIERHIDVMQVQVGESLVGFLHTSAEYGMKQLIARGLGDIYQLSHVFRKGEISALHQPEFSMVEWYRLGYTFEEMIEETLDFTRLFLSDKPVTTLTYREALSTYAGIDYVTAKTNELLACASHYGLELSAATQASDRDTLLQCLMSFLVEPNLPRDQLVVVRDYPASQAALAQTRPKGDEMIAERFEVYVDGIELANGYHELTDAAEQRKRFLTANALRSGQGKETLPIDEEFLAALESGLPDCCGVAVGFDRLMMLRLGAKEIAEVLPLAITTSTPAR